MKRVRALLTASVLVLAACAHDGPAYGPASDAAATVTMTSGMRFDPGEITIRAGQAVEWRNRAIMTHTVTATGFDSGDIKPGQIWRHTFTAPGRYAYVCKPHEGMGMKGVVVVR